MAENQTKSGSGGGLQEWRLTESLFDLNGITPEILKQLSEKGGYAKLHEKAIDAGSHTHNVTLGTLFILTSKEQVKKLAENGNGGVFYKIGVLDDFKGKKIPKNIGLYLAINIAIDL